MIAKQALVVALLCAPSLVHAQAKISDAHCDDSARITSMMTERLGAEQRAFGLRDPETMMEVWVNPQNHEWMLIQSYSNGRSCIVALGEHWEQRAPQDAPS